MQEGVLLEGDNAGVAFAPGIVGILLYDPNRGIEYVIREGTPPLNLPQAVAVLTKKERKTMAEELPHYNLPLGEAREIRVDGSQVYPLPQGSDQTRASFSGKGHVQILLPPDIGRRVKQIMREMPILRRVA